MADYLVIATWNFGMTAVKTAAALLEEGKPALDAAIAGAQAVEDDPKVHTVGYAGLGNALGTVQLDACVMDGQTLGCGAVAGVENIRHVAALARRVMEKTPHILLVGEGAKLFGIEQGFPLECLSTPESMAEWEKTRKQKKQWEQPKLEGPPKGHDTVAVLARDGRGSLGGVCTTSGLPHKLPGRVGDSPLIGHGLYVDNTAGAAGATGTGEEIIRIGGSLTVVESMRAGHSAQEADAFGHSAGQGPSRRAGQGQGDPWIVLPAKEFYRLHDEVAAFAPEVTADKEEAPPGLALRSTWDVEGLGGRGRVHAAAHGVHVRGRESAVLDQTAGEPLAHREDAAGPFVYSLLAGSTATDRRPIDPEVAEELVKALIQDLEAQVLVEEVGQAHGSEVTELENRVEGGACDLPARRPLDQALSRRGPLPSRGPPPVQTSYVDRLQDLPGQTGDPGVDVDDFSPLHERLAEAGWNVGPGGGRHRVPDTDEANPKAPLSHTHGLGPGGAGGVAGATAAERPNIQ